jgi:hypothetical protein
MEYVQTITAMSTCGLLAGDASLSVKVEETYGASRLHAGLLIESARNHASGDVKVTWSFFGGRKYEKCAIEWMLGGVRMTDVVWFKRGHRWG